MDDESNQIWVSTSMRITNRNYTFWCEQTSLTVVVLKVLVIGV